MIVPNTDLYLLKCPLELDDLNQLTFANASAQHSYFNGLPKVGFEDFTYQRKDNVVRIPALIDDIHSYNYVMYRNDNYSSKWFYAFIEDMEYLNDNVTAVKIKTDTFQTWQFDLTYKPTFVAREHTNDDTIGSNTQPESVELGEPIINGAIVSWSPFTSYLTPLNGYYITFMVSDISILPYQVLDQFPPQYNGIFSGYYIFGVKTLAEAQAVVKWYVDPTGMEGSYADAIKNIFLVPKCLFGLSPQSQITDYGFTMYLPNVYSSVASLATINFNKVNTLDGYQPKNNKLYTWPYSYVLASNNVGGNAEYRYEDFSSNTPSFDVKGIISSGCDIELIPTHYKRVDGVNHIYGLNLGKLPVCSWNTDAYAVWLAQTQLNMQVSLTRNVLKAGVGLATKNPELIGGGIGSFGGDVLNALSEKYIAQNTPDEVHGNPNGSDFNFSSDLYFDFRRMSVRAEYARVIDNYFSALGYATNLVKIPNVTGRRNWNYVKTIGCYIEANIPQNDLNEIKSMFDKGITFWHNPATFMDYSQNNDII